MKANQFIATMAVVLFWANPVFAQNNVDVGLQEEISQESGDGQQQHLRRKQSATPAAGVVIMNNQSSEQSSAQASRLSNNNQPVTYVEASPIAESRADQIRKARQNTEIETEQKIVEKLEVSRMEDEKRRADRLFGNRLEVEQQQSVVVSSAPVAIRKEEKEEVVVIKEKAPEAPKASSKLAIGGGAGITSYQVDNVQSNQSFGVTLGSESSDGLIIEGQFMYSNHFVQNYFSWPLYKEMDQYNFGAALKYSFMKNSRIQPFAGALASYTYRRYHNRLVGTNQQPNSPYLPRDQEVTTHAVDLGLTAGLDFMVNETFSVGGDFRYSMNVYNRINNNFFNAGYIRSGTPLEEMSYYTMMLNAKMRF